MQRRPIPNSVESQLTYWLHYVGFRVSYQLCLRTQKFGITAAESVVLRKLYGNDAMPSHLARSLGFARGTISKLAARLEAKQLLSRKKSLPDRRAKLLSLTSIGRAVVPVLDAMAEEVDGRNFSRVGQEPHETIERVMKWIVRCSHRRFVPLGRCRISPTYHYGGQEFGYELSGLTGLECQPNAEQ